MILEIKICHNKNWESFLKIKSFSKKSLKESDYMYQSNYCALSTFHRNVRDTAVMKFSFQPRPLKATFK